MSEHDLEIVRDGIAAYNAGDWDTLLAMLHPDVELYALRSALDGDTYHGLAGFRRFLDDVSEEWAEFTIVPEEYRDLGDGRVFMLARYELRGRASGVEMVAEMAWLFELSEGRATYIRAYSDRAEAVRQVEALAPGRRA